MRYSSPGFPCSAVLLVVVCVANAREPALQVARAEVADRETLEFVVLAPRQTIRVRLDVLIDDRPVARWWGETFDWLLARHDRDDNGGLDTHEANLLPSAFALRKAAWQPMNPFNGPAPSWSMLDVDSSGRASRAEIARYYSSHGLGNVLVAVGRPPASTALSDALLNRLDANDDHRVSEHEWLQAATTLLPLDSNGDELIGPGELVENALYPGATGNVLVSSPDVGRNLVTGSTPLIVVLPNSAFANEWAKVVVEQRDGDGDGQLETTESMIDGATCAKLDRDADGRVGACELANWRDLPPTVHWQVRFVADGDPAASLTSISPVVGSDRQACGNGFHSQQLSLTVRADVGQLPESMVAARHHMENLFARADTDHDDVVDEAEVAERTFNELKQLLSTNDRDGNRRQSAGELASWLDFQQQVAGGCIMLTLLDYGQGLFELLDSNRDGALSLRELREAWDTLGQAGCTGDSTLHLDRLPYRLEGVVSRGHARSLLDARPGVDGPEWFLAMDRNGDGDVSQREFLGSAPIFQQMDADRDGLLSAAEAAPAP
jgi:Ca2+-binding EF-hand superfamily protein